ncbi:hypothetical protein [Gemella cuniculi]|uniref:hypothetical protein n=1 Tax=Gemella cuniculi TaxID=150240 RepID=UPI00041A118E|nr:hypothetical protein [Gemella cuniculi]
MSQEKKLTQYAKRQARLTEEEKAKEKEIRNAKDRQRFSENLEAKEKKKYRTYKSTAFKFVEMAQQEHLQELKKK